MFNTYIPKSELDLTKSNTSLLEIKCNELDTLVKAQRKVVDNNSTTLGNLRNKRSREPGRRIRLTEDIRVYHLLLPPPQPITCCLSLFFPLLL